MSNRILYLGLDPSHFKGQGEIIHWPIIEIVPRPLSEGHVYKALKNFDIYSHVLITSKSTVAILREYLLCLNIPLESWAEKATLAVGQITNIHLQACGIKPARVARNETAEGLIDELKLLGISEGAHVFFPHSSQSRPIIQDYLVEQRVRHTACVLYDPKPTSLQPHLDLTKFDEIVFTSPSTVDAFLGLFGEFPLKIRLTPIGPITAHHLDQCLIRMNSSNE